MNDERNGWQEHKRDVLRRLEDHAIDLQRIESEVGRIADGLAETRGKVIAWGAVAAMIVGGVVSLIVTEIRSGKAPVGADHAEQLNDTLKELIDALNQEHKGQKPARSRR